MYSYLLWITVRYITTLKPNQNCVSQYSLIEYGTRFGPNLDKRLLFTLSLGMYFGYVENFATAPP